FTLQGPLDQESVLFGLNGTVVKTVPVTPASDSVINLTAPDLSSLISQIPAGSNSLTIDVLVEIDDPITGTHLQSPATSADQLLFFLPTVTSVVDQSTKTNEVTINGGDPLVVNGSGFTLQGPLDQESVLFGLNGTVVKTVPVTPASDSVINLTAPDLSSLISQIPARSNPLPSEVLVEIYDPLTGTHLQSPATSADQLLFFLPTVTSVVDQSTKTNEVTINGGDPLVVNGSGFTLQGPLDQ